MTTFHVFCDESHLSPHTYRIQGGIWVRSEGLREVRQAFTELRARHPKAGELRWGKVDGREPWRVYLDLMDLFFSGPAAKHLSFKCIVVHSEDDRSRNGDKHERDLGFYKAYWTLLSHRLLANCTYHIRLDQRSSPRLKDPEGQLQERLNNTGYNKGSYWDVLTCRGECSKREDLLQLADVLLGAIGWAWNGRRSTCGAKPGLERYIADKLRWKDLARDTAMNSAKANIWKYTPKTR
ncbi:MAG: DUF3800 domain-containing protein [Gemmatimonas sp.]|uniref:DUF3800 domain-containing protein n=1 Tax=Gemmatimonas sp. TaxID=1962908 RepID=UPI0031B8453E